MAMITIREATSADLDILCAIGIQTFSDSFGVDNTPSNMQAYLNEAFDRRKIEKEMQESGTCFFLALDATVPVGYAKVRYNDEVEAELGQNALELHRIYVVKDYLGKKVGAKLIQSCLAHAKSNKMEWIWLGVWENNVAAQKFYKNWGFEKFDEHIFQMGDDPQVDWLMKRRI